MEKQSSGGVTGRVVGVFAVIGLGLGVAALLFLWATDYFKEGGDDLGSAIAGGLALGAVMVFALLSGVVVAALGGMHAAHVTPSREGAITAALVGGLLGHMIMVAALGGVMTLGFGLLSPEDGESPSAPATPTPDPECAETFGADSPICNAGRGPETSVQEGPEEEDGIDVQQLLKLGLGAMPAGVVGGLSAAILFSRRDEDYE